MDWFLHDWDLCHERVNNKSFHIVETKQLINIANQLIGFYTDDVI